MHRLYFYFIYSAFICKKKSKKIRLV